MTYLKKSWNNKVLDKTLSLNKNTHIIRKLLKDKLPKAKSRRNNSAPAILNHLQTINHYKVQDQLQKQRLNHLET